MRLRYALAVLALAGGAMPAQAAATPGWQDWTARAKAIDLALWSGAEEPAAIEAACAGIGDAVNGQRFPGWARELVGICAAIRGGWVHGFNAGTAKPRCADLRRSVAIFKRSLKGEKRDRAPADAVLTAAGLLGTIQGGMDSYC